MINRLWLLKVNLMLWLCTKRLAFHRLVFPMEQTIFHCSSYHSLINLSESTFGWMQMKQEEIQLRNLPKNWVPRELWSLTQEWMIKMVPKMPMMHWGKDWTLRKFLKKNQELSETKICCLSATSKKRCCIESSTTTSYRVSNLSILLSTTVH
jgi:hypothetical protein